ncbi:DUF2867 domain-containing protein [Phreatobacter stygius]|uniref:DUF2867 domain-containing protein n=2 Tax=Phreatobacter stygius TaxID=1940610 RepID=A0A4D7BNF8_9HYPH|nr:DUF2867 domain-containing protein [Phreatobacter stygius]QCI69427.1 DUF2867 domain-containing protein [Phreatobacter stygius]
MMVQAVEPDVEIGQVLAGAQFADAYSVVVDEVGMDARTAAERAFGRSPRWVNTLLGLRNAVVAPFGLKAGQPSAAKASDRIGIFPVISETPHRLIAGLDDKHLDFRMIVDVSEAGGRRRVTATTLVKTHNLLGRTYLAAILPFHRVIVRTMVAQVVAPAR